MELIAILNRGHRFRGFVYQHAHFTADKKSIEVADRARVRPQSPLDAICRRRVMTNSPNGALSSFRCGGFSSSFCTPCGASTVAAVAVEEVPWGDGKRTLTKAYMLMTQLNPPDVSLDSPPAG
jgi:hypothetical protein